MASTYLPTSVISHMTEKLTEKFLKDYKEKYQNLKTYFEKQSLKMLDSKVLEIFNKYPEYFITRNYITIELESYIIKNKEYKFYKKTFSDKIYWFSEYYFDNTIFKNFIYSIISNDEKNDLENMIIDFDISTKVYYEMKNKINCVLEKIGTAAKLKNEFPEAYVIYEQLQKEKESYFKSLINSFNEKFLSIK